MELHDFFQYPADLVGTKDHLRKASTYCTTIEMHSEPDKPFSSSMKFEAQVRPLTDIASKSIPRRH